MPTLVRTIHTHVLRNPGNVMVNLTALAEMMRVFVRPKVLYIVFFSFKYGSFITVIDLLQRNRV